MLEGKVVARFQTRLGSVGNILFTPIGRGMTTQGEEKKMKFWALEPSPKK